MGEEFEEAVGEARSGPSASLSSGGSFLRRSPSSVSAYVARLVGSARSSASRRSISPSGPSKLAAVARRGDASGQEADLLDPDPARAEVVGGGPDVEA